MKKIKYTGKNFNEVNNFTGGKLIWATEDLYWTDNYPPKDLSVRLSDSKSTLKPGYYIVEDNNGNFIMEACYEN